MIGILLKSYFWFFIKKTKFYFSDEGLQESENLVLDQLSEMNKHEDIQKFLRGLSTDEGITNNKLQFLFKGIVYFSEAKYLEANLCFFEAGLSSKNSQNEKNEFYFLVLQIISLYYQQKWSGISTLFQKCDKILEKYDLISEKIILQALHANYLQLEGLMNESHELLKSANSLNDLSKMSLAEEQYILNKMFLGISKISSSVMEKQYLKSFEISQEVLSNCSNQVSDKDLFLKRLCYCGLIQRLEIDLELGYWKDFQNTFDKIHVLSQLFEDSRELQQLEILLKQQYDFYHLKYPLSIDEWINLLKTSVKNGFYSYVLRQNHRLLKYFYKNFSPTVYEKLWAYYQSLIKQYERKIPLSSRKHFYDLYEFSPKKKFKISSQDLLMTIVEVSRELLNEDNFSLLSKKTLQVMIDFTQMERGVVVLKDREDAVISSVFKLREQDVLVSDHIDHFVFQVCKQVLDSKKTVLIPDIDKIQNWDASFDLSKCVVGEQKSFYCIPLIFEDEIYGCVYLDSHVRRPADVTQDKTFLENFALNAAIALKTAMKFEQKDKTIATYQKKISAQQSQLQDKYSLKNFVGVSQKSRELLQVIQKIADSNATVLVTGESGVGKELVSKVIHYESERKNHEFLALNCGAIPENLLESELFGYEKGAFTDAAESKAGLFEKAGMGTIFLDEIGEMPLKMQVKILRVLEERVITRLGSAEEIPIKCRVICATNRNLEEMVKEGTFRQDLFYRINVLSVRVPSLRERRDDITLLVQHALELYAKENEVEPKKITSDALKFLMNYPWPGNIRELINIIYNLSIFVDEEVIDLKELKERPELFQLNEMLSKIDPDEMIANLSRKIEKGQISLSSAKQEFEKFQLMKALRLASGKITGASHYLQMPRPQVSRLVKKYGLKDEDKQLLN